MQPGKALEVTAELVSRDGAAASFKAKGEAEGTQTVSAQFTLAGYNLRDHNPALADRDERLIRHWKSLYQLLTGQLAIKAG